jgi:Tetratricopeptide repeat/CHAT domain
VECGNEIREPDGPLTLWLALAASSSLTAPSLAQKGETAALSARINELSRTGKYSEGLSLVQAQLESLEKKYGPFHRDVARSLNNLASLYQTEGRTIDALPIVESMIASGRAQPRVALPVLFAARRQQSMPSDKALDDALNVVQRGTQSSAASAVNKLAVRLAACNDGLAQLVRRDQDLAAEAETLDKALVAAISKDRSKRDSVAERALLVSHWAVDSEATTRLTTSTFDRLKADRNLGRAEALRQAMLAYRGDVTQKCIPGILGTIRPDRRRSAAIMALFVHCKDIIPAVVALGRAAREKPKGKTKGKRKKNEKPRAATKLRQINCPPWNKPKREGLAWQARRSQLLGRRTGAGRLYYSSGGHRDKGALSDISAIEIRGFEEVLRARYGRA